MEVLSTKERVSMDFFLLPVILRRNWDIVSRKNVGVDRKKLKTLTMKMVRSVAGCHERHVWYLYLYRIHG